MTSSNTNHLDSQRHAVERYYSKTESLIGYKYLMHRTKHFGYYEPNSSGVPFNPALRRMEARLASKLQVGSDCLVLDAGCGMGMVSCEIAARTGAKVAGIDVLDFNLEEARLHAKDVGLESRVDFSLMDYSSLEFEDEKFDAVYTMETFVHAADPTRVLAEFRRVLKPGGRLVMLEYARQRPENMTEKANRAFEEVNRLAAMPAFQDILFFDVMPNLLKDAGFSDVERSDLTQNILPMLKVFKRLAFFPYRILRLLNKVEKGVNAMSAVEFYRYKDDFKYEMYTAVRPTD